MGKQKKNMAKRNGIIRDAYTGKPVRSNQEVVLVENIVVYARKLGYIISNYRFVFFGLFFVLFLSSIYALFLSQNTVTYNNLNVSQNITISNIQNFTSFDNIKVRNNSYLRFDGVNDYINTSSNLLTTSPMNFTISLWVKYEGASRYMFGQVDSTGTNGIIVQCALDGTVQYFINASLIYTIPGGYNCQNNFTSWRNVLITYNGSYYWYIDGVKVHNTTRAYPVITSQGFSIGNRGDYTRGWNGTIDEFRLYNVSLSDSQINQIYRSGLISNSSLNFEGLIAWYNFEEYGNVTILDKSGRGNHAT